MFLEKSTFQAEILRKITCLRFWFSENVWEGWEFHECLNLRQLSEVCDICKALNRLNQGEKIFANIPNEKHVFQNDKISKKLRYVFNSRKKHFFRNIKLIIPVLVTN